MILTLGGSFPDPNPVSKGTASIWGIISPCLNDNRQILLWDHTVQLKQGDMGSQMMMRTKLK